MIGAACYSVVPDPNTIYFLYNSIRLFYQNGGGDAYIVSVGTYGPQSKQPAQPGENIVNPNIQLSDLLAGLALLKNESEPTMYICPEATLLSVADNGTLMQAMMLQCSGMQTAISIFDIIGGRIPDPVMFMDDIDTFRNHTGNQGLNYGAAYYPFVGTTIMQQTEIDYTNLFGGDITQLAPVVNPSDDPNPAAAAVLANMQNPASGLTVQQNNNVLINASNTYGLILTHVLNDANILPASGGMAGVITTTDNTQGPWIAPANTSFNNVVSLPVNLSGTQQAPLNVDAVSGKSINVIRSFSGQGILIWGARTLDGNSNDWRYISVRRTINFLQQSCKLAIQAFVFEPNDVRTWQTITSMLNNFLTIIWKQGGLQGASANDAFHISCGAGTTMTGEDILNGILIVTVMMAVVHPAEFIVFSIQQQQAAGGN